MAGGTVVNTWQFFYSRTPAQYLPGPPPLSPLAVGEISNTAGNWLFAVVSWRQDAGTAGVLQYPSTANVSDDAGNFWIPLRTSGTTGIVRCAVWMAPAARAAEFVFVSPTAYQSALTVMIVEVTADCPWYEVQLTDSIHVNQGTTASISQNPGVAGLFAVGTLMWDNSAAVTPVSTGWAQIGPQFTVSNGLDHTGDLYGYVWRNTNTGSTMTLSASTATTMDFGAVIVTVQGVANTIAFPYTVPDAENWPVLVTEIASGPVLNADPVLLQGTTFWSGSNGGSVASVTWPVYQPWPNYQALQTPSLSLTPSGSTSTPKAASELEPVSVVVQYNALAYVYSPAGFGNVTLAIDYFTSGSSYISSATQAFSVPAGAWTQLTFAAPGFPPDAAAFGAVSMAEVSGGNVPASAVLYIGYAGFGPADAYEDFPPDETAWTDVSTRNFTQGDIKVSRGIQYQQQSLEAGTMTVYLDSNDGQMMFGNILSSFWPTAGDTDVPIRLRAVWQQSITPYYPLFSGFTDQIEFGWDEDEGTWYGYAQVEASDGWSRLTSQLVGAAEQEVLSDNPAQYWTCSLSGANLAPGAATALVTGTSQYGAGGATASFNSSVISLAGDPGVSCWQSTGTSLGDLAFNGVALTWTAVPSMALSAGITLEFWMSPQSVSAAQPGEILTVCAAWSPTGLLWTITVDNTAGGPGSTASITVYDKGTGAATTTSIGTGTFLGPVNAVLPWFFAVTFTQSSLTVTVNPLAGIYETVTVSCNLASQLAALSFGGCIGPVYHLNYGGTPGFMDLAVYGVAVTAGKLPNARITAHYQTASTAYPGELDTARLARIAGYAGATPVVMAMRSLDITVAADEDLVTGVTDTNGQVVSSYFTNIASSTLAFMFVNGAGSLVYRRRLEAYDRPFPQWVLGESAPYPLNANTLGGSASLSGWGAGDGATLSLSSLSPSAAPQAGPLFYPYCGLFHGNGSTAGANIGTAGGHLYPITPGDWYTVSALIYSPQGWGSGITLFQDYYTSGLAGVGGNSVAAVVPAGSLLYLQTPPAQATATAALAAIFIQVTGIPPSTTQFYVADVQLTQVQPVTAGGAGATAPEAPYLPSAKLSSDRALLFNQAILTQYGTSIVSKFTGTSVDFGPSSGVIVNIQNQASVNQRAGIPYVATVYLDNTAQALPYQLNDPSMEDLANWITQTLAAPLLRPETVSITPVSTPQAMLTALGAEIGDTATFRRRPQTGGAPEIQVLTYVSKLTHTINMAKDPPWKTEYELSPFPQGTVLACDDVIHGTLTGGNLLGW